MKNLIFLLIIFSFTSCATVEKQDNLLDECNDTLRDIGACYGDAFRFTGVSVGKTKNEQRVL